MIIIAIYLRWDDIKTKLVSVSCFWLLSSSDSRNGNTKGPEVLRPQAGFLDLLRVGGSGGAPGDLGDRG